MPKLQMLWMDLTVSLKEGEIPAEFHTHCEPVFCPDPEHLDRMLARQPIDLICFDFDYPDRTGLRWLRDVKVEHPSLPSIMLTVQHSESLAIWAFRTKVWDYLVKPVPKYEVERCLLALLRVLGFRQSQPPRHASMHGQRIPDEISYCPKPEDSMLAPAIYYVEKYFRSKIRSEDVAALCGLSPFRFSRAFKDTFGLTFRDYLVGYRLREACRLLENPTVTVTDVAFAVGFNDASYFARIFKHRIGVAPSLLVGHPLADVKTGNGAASLPELPEIIL